MSNYDLVKEFHRALDIPIRNYPQIPPRDRRKLRIDLIAEEFKELSDASFNADLVEVADALADLLYVTYGAALEWGIDITPVFEEVHRSNMTKVGPDGAVTIREDGKILKPPTFTPPDIKKVLDGQRLDLSTQRV